MKEGLAWLTAILVLAIGITTGYIVRSQAQPAPILVVVNGAAPNPYGPYLAEILRAEGINTFAVADLSTVTSTSLSGVSLVVLAETPLTDPQAVTFSNFVAGGGRLVAMRPDSRLDSTLNLTHLTGTTNEGYIRVNSAHASATGFTTTTLPYHGAADHYSLGSGSSALATVFSGQATSTSFAAVVTSGRTATWSYDLARTVLYTRQGNPANAGVDRDGLAPVRTNDVFYNAIDKDRINIPHADVQMRLFARVVKDLLSDAMPLPSLWYFPNAAKTLLVVTADSHANPETWFDDEIAAFNARGVKASIYMNGGATPSVAAVQTWRSQGHEVGMHPAAFSKGLTLDQAYQNNTNYFVNNGYGAPSTTTRNHQIEWQGWVDAAKVAANYGIAMDTSFYTWGPAVTYPDGHQAHGYINGSGQLMRFMDQTGAIVPVWGLSTPLNDEQLLVETCGSPTLICSEQLTGAEALAVSQQLIDASQAGDYAAIMTQFHVDYFSWADVNTWALGTMDYANSLGIPNRTAESFQRYTADRAATAVSGLTWIPGPRQLTFTAAVPAGGASQTMTVPASYQGHPLLDVSVNGAAVGVTTQTITGRSLAMFSVPPSANGVPVVVTYSGGTPALSISSASVTEGTGGSQNATFTVTLSPAASSTVTVQFATADGTATAPADYSSTSGTLTFAAGVTSRTVTVPIVTDSVFESDETFSVVLSNPSVNATIFRGTGTGTILNDDAPPPALSVSGLSALEGNSGGTNVAVAVTLSPASTQTVTVNWATQNGTAASGTDYVAAAGTLTFAPGVTAQTIPVTILGDVLIEPHETLSVVLSNSANALIASGTATVTILNDDAIPTLGTLTQTTRSDFACGVLTNTIATQGVNGEVRLAGTFGDEFSSAALSSQWTAKTWAGGAYVPSIAGGVMSIGNASGAYVRSTATQTVSVLEGRVQFTAAQWEHVGWADLDFASKYLIFSTYNTTNTLFARTNTGGGEQQTNLGPIPSGTHTYRIERVSQGANDQILYSIDGTVVATHTTAALAAPLFVYQSNSGGATPTLNVDNLWTYPTHVATGSFDSCSLDAGTDVAWTNATWTAQTPAGTSLGVRVRTSTDNLSWTAWAPLVASGQTVNSAAGRYLQYGLDLSSTNPATSPVLESIAFSYGYSGTPTLSVNSVSVAEGNAGVSNAVFTVTLNGGSTNVVTANYATLDGTATAGSDYVATSGALTFQPGITTQTVSVPINGDTTFEPNETFQFVLSNAVNANIGAAGVGTIVNDEVPPPSLAISGASTLEGNSGTGTAVVTVTMTPAISLPVTVNWATQDGTAIAGLDYTAGSGSLTFAPGTTSLTIPIGIVGDTAIEGDETFTVALSGAAEGIITTGTGTVIILNDDAVPTVGSFTRTTRSEFACGLQTGTMLTAIAGGEVRLAGTFGDEFAGASLGSQWTSGTWAGGAYAPGLGSGVLSIGDVSGAWVRSTAVQTIATFEAQLEFTASPWEHAGWADQDFAGKYLIFSTYNTNNTLFVRSNTGTGEQTTNLGPIPAGVHTYRIDRVIQGATSNIVYSIDGVAVATHTVSGLPPSLFVYFSNNGGAAPTLNVDSLWLYPPHVPTGSFVSCAIDAGVNVNWTNATWTAQVPVSTTLGVKTRSSVDGTTWSGWAPLVASGQAIASPAGRFLEFGLDMATTDAAVSPSFEAITVGVSDPVPAVSTTGLAVAEGNAGSTNAVFTVALDLAATQQVTVNYTTADGTALSTSDYITTAGTLTFAPGVTSQTVAVPVIGDTTFESTETFTLNLSGPVNAVLITPQVVGTITNDDPQPSVSIAGVSLAEGNARTQSASFAVTLSSASAFPVTVNYATADGSATAGSDYTATSGTLTFAPGVTQQNIPVTVLGDAIFESDETFVVNLSAVSGGTLGTAQATGTIVNDEATPSLSIGNVSVTEGNAGSQNATFTVTLSPVSALTTTVDWATVNGTASAGSDYTAGAGTLTFAPGTTTQTLSVAVLGDVLFEANETFTVTLSGATNAVIGTATGTGTIVNDDAAPNLTINNVSIAEGNAGTVNATFTVTQSAVSGLTTTVNYATANGSATAGSDYTAVSGTLTFAPSVVTQTVTVPVTGDTLFEANETFTVTLSGAANAAIATATGTGTITNDDAAPVLSATGASVVEGNSGTTPMTFTVTLSAASGATTTVNYATANGTASSLSDFTTASGTLTFAPGVTSQTITVNVTGDTVFEPNETFVVNFSGATNATLGTTQVPGTITNDDAQPTLTVSNPSVGELNTVFGIPQTSTLNFVVTLSNASSVATSVNFATANGTATAGSDYTARTTTTLTIPAGSLTGTIAVTVLGDTTPEADETVLLNLSSPVNATLAQTQATGTIIDNDGTVTVTAPNTAVVWTLASARTITWSTTGFASGSTFRVELSRDGGTTWSTLSASVAIGATGTGSFNWTVTGPATTTARVRVTWTGNSNVTDISNVNFTIQ